MYLVYIAGKMSADTIYEYKQNILAGEKVMIKWLEAGCSVICPHRNTGFLDGCINHGGEDHEFWLRNDFEQIRRCDAIVMMTNWVHSSGAIAEHNFAEENGIPIIYEEV